ncbi:hypothetical protein [Speluncibacter jeojiensis]|uniref:Uncharacterized protein n=1 Tax=Speluncibacter jeojiensis TaxID=2710754 RepID=A0A9X4M1H2_9ACTN|nr:hypothetical protein [Corynebacteriales bacterium D3-21]
MDASDRGNVAGSAYRRWWRRLLRRPRPADLDPARSDLEVVVAGFDEVESCAAALERGAAGLPTWREADPAVFRHHLCLPPDRVEEACALAAQDGYAAAVAASPAAEPVVALPGEVAVVLQRVQRLDPLHCAQERSRMAGLAQRHDGRLVGWDALQPPAGD